MSAYTSSTPSDPTQTSQPPSSDVKTPENKANEESDIKWSRILKVSNAINAIVLMLAGVAVFLLISSPSLIVILSALYVIFFSLLLFCFECHFQSFDSVILGNFGFMFKWQGRCLFFFFTGTLCFGLGTTGYIAGALTLGNVFFNIYVLVKHSSVKNYTNQENAQAKLQARGSSAPANAGPTNALNSPPAASSTSTPNPYAANPYAQPAPKSSYPSSDSNPFSVDVGVNVGGQSVTVPVSVGVAEGGSGITLSASTPSLSSASASPGPDWERNYDSNTSRYYFYNAKTGESRWET